jgi:cytochrome P450
VTLCTLFVCKTNVAQILNSLGDSDRAITPDDLKEMKYLERCIKEALRLCPPVPLFARQVTEDTDARKYFLIVLRYAQRIIPPKAK